MPLPPIPEKLCVDCIFAITPTKERHHPKQCQDCGGERKNFISKTRTTYGATCPKCGKIAIRIESLHEPDQLGIDMMSIHAIRDFVDPFGVTRQRTPMEDRCFFSSKALVKEPVKEVE